MKFRLCTLSLTLLLAAACNNSNTPATPAPANLSALTATTPAVPTITSPVTAEGFIQNWLVLDPIAIEGVGDHTEEVEKPMFAKEYFKGQLTLIPRDNQKVTANGKEVTWHKVKVDADQIDLEQFCTDHNTDPTSCIFYGFTYVIAEADMKVKLAVGSDDSSLWWLNGEEVIRDYASRGVTADDDLSKDVTLKKGLNILRFAVIQGDGPTGACARFFDASDKPVTGIKVSADTP